MCIAAFFLNQFPHSNSPTQILGYGIALCGLGYYNLADKLASQTAAPVANQVVATGGQ
jgi:hypothetical protein